MDVNYIATADKLLGLFLDAVGGSQTFLFLAGFILLPNFLLFLGSNLICRYCYFYATGSLEDEPIGVLTKRIRKSND